MVFSHVQKTFRPIRKHLSKHTCDFMLKSRLRRLAVVRCFEKPTNIDFFVERAHSSSKIKFKAAEKPSDDHIIEQENKNTRAKTTRDVELLIESLREKQDQSNPKDNLAEQLNEHLFQLILSVKRRDGQD